jgi:hypothetical protein
VPSSSLAQGVLELACASRFFSFHTKQWFWPSLPIDNIQLGLVG